LPPMRPRVASTGQLDFSFIDFTTIIKDSTAQISAYLLFEKRMVIY